MKSFSKFLVCVSLFSCIALFANERSGEFRKEQFEEAAKSGDARAQYNLGVIYFAGSGVKQDYKEAVRLFTLSAKQGYGNAQCFLGLCYLFNKGVEQDYEKAVECFRKAAAQGIAEAEFNLGWCYFNGKGVTADQAEALKWFEKAAAKGHTRAAEYTKKKEEEERYESKY